MEDATRTPSESLIKTNKLPFPSLLLSFFLLFTTPLTSALTAQTTQQHSVITSQNFLTYYTVHCNHIVSQSPTSGTRINPSFPQHQMLYIDIAYFTGGNQILHRQPVISDSSLPITLSFNPKVDTIFLTETPHVFSFQGALKFRLPHGSNITFRGRKRGIRFRPPRFPVQTGSLAFDLYGYWSMSSGKLCMVGSESSFGRNLGGVSNLHNVALKLDFPAYVGNVTSLVTGVLESLNDKGSFGYFEPISILGIPHFAEYHYTLIHQGSENVCATGGENENDNVRLDMIDPSSCLTSLYKYARTFELEYGSECRNNTGGKCDPFGGSFEGLPKFMAIQGIRCDYGHAIQVLIGFSNLDYHGFPIYRFERFFDPSKMLIGEGTWDEKSDRLCIVACHALNFKDSLANASIGDCSIQLSVRFPRILTIGHMNTVVGQILSNKAVNDTGYFHRIGFHGNANRVRGLPHQKYAYTVLDKVSKCCAKTKTLKGKGKTYPSGFSYDMRFDMSVKNSKGQITQGYSSPLFVGDQFYAPNRMNNNYSGLLNISYRISFTAHPELMLGGELLSNETVLISAEGTYDTETGVLCMIGCWHPLSSIKKSLENHSDDCEILIRAQFSPLNAKGVANLKGSIESMRGKSDPHYFKQLEITSESIYVNQAEESIWRMDMEISMVLISNTLACIFVGLQLYHVKRHPGVLPCISFMMLVVLTLGHMIPLVLNFEALFMTNHNPQNVFLESGGWLEVNEVAVRVVTMVAFVLEFRLLLLSWSARQTEGSHKICWRSEKRVLYLSLPLYIGGGLIAWYVHEWKSSSKNPFLRHGYRRFKHSYRLRDLKSYAGLILDGFLVPQILFNLFLNSQENTLAPAFYVGTTIVRILPHAYDLYRAHSSPWYLDLSYIYANQRQDYYSTTWNIIIPLGGLLLAALIYLQQRVGGRFVVPKRFREASEYEMVSTVTREELQGEAVR